MPVINRAYPPDALWLFSTSNNLRRSMPYTLIVPHPKAYSSNRPEFSPLRPRRYIYYFTTPTACIEHYDLGTLAPLTARPYPYQHLKVSDPPILRHHLQEMDEALYETFRLDPGNTILTPTEHLKNGDPYFLVPVNYDKTSAYRDFPPAPQFRYLTAILGDIAHKPSLYPLYLPLMELLYEPDFRCPGLSSETAPQVFHRVSLPRKRASNDA